MSSWKIVVNFVLPPPVILTLVLISPLPKKVRKGVLLFADKFLSFPVVGGAQLVHIMIFITALVFAAAVQQTVRANQAFLDETLTPNQKTSLLAKKWREERNFWIAMISFLLWCVCTRLYQLGVSSVRMQDKIEELTGKPYVEEEQYGKKVKKAPAGFLRRSPATTVTDDSPAPAGGKKVA